MLLFVQWQRPQGLILGHNDADRKPGRTAASTDVDFFYWHGSSALKTNYIDDEDDDDDDELMLNVLRCQLTY